MRIELLWFDDCPNHEAAGTMLREVLVEQGSVAPCCRIEVLDLATGERVRFPGSPTIRVDGVDIEPDFEDGGDYTPRCRLYATSAGLGGMPEREWIEAALTAAG